MYKHFVEVSAMGITVDAVRTTVGVADCNRTFFCEIRVVAWTGEDV
jgi:hypothetical protein